MKNNTAKSYSKERIFIKLSENDIKLQQ